MVVNDPATQTPAANSSGADARRERAIRNVRDAAFAPLVAAVYGREPEYYSSMIERMAPTRPQFFVAPMGRVGLTRWLLEVTSDEPTDVELDNFDDPEELSPARAA